MGIEFLFKKKKSGKSKIRKTEIKFIPSIMLCYTEWHISFAKEWYYHSYSSMFNKKKEEKKWYLKTSSASLSTLLIIYIEGQFLVTFF